MARTKKVGRSMGSCTVWNRNTSLGRPIGRCSKPVDKRKRKRDKTMTNGVSADTTPETSVETESPQQTCASSDSVVGSIQNDRSSSSPRVVNGAASLSTQMNAELRHNLLPIRNTGALFHSLCYSEDVLSSLPNRTWAIHCTEIPEKRIVVSAMMMYNSHDTGLSPFYIKQIIFDERLNFDLLLVNSRIVLKDKPMSISTMDEFEDLLDYVDRLKVCSGGPSISQYSRVNPECAYRDSMNNWRHNLCSLEISTGDVCESCKSLDEILRRHAQRNRPMVKSAGKRKR